jgi:hypothetical protein
MRSALKKILYITSAIAFTFCRYDVQAQVAVSNQGVLYVTSSSDIVFINGTFTNNSTASLTNNGLLYVKQDLTNDQASMSTGSGTLILNGSTAQNVGGAQPFKTNNLITDNTSGITLNTDVSVSGVHTFTNGLIASSATPNYLIYESGASYSGDNDSRHVIGWVKKNGSGNFTFPVGNASFERSIAISSLTAASEFNCKYFAPTSNTSRLAAPLVQVKANEYWQLDKISGANAQVTFNWNHAKVAMDNVLVAEILAASYTATFWTSRGGTASGNVTTTGTITSNSMSLFGSLTLGYKTYPIPLKLLAFSADRRNAVSLLKWTTENEENVDRFEIQRSYDGSVFQTIGAVAARNNSQLENYNYDDHNSFQGLAYYRLKTFDIDGKYSYSNIAVVSENKWNSEGIIAVNPAHTTITLLNKTGKAGLYNYKLYSSAGGLLAEGAVSMSANGGAAIPIPPQIAGGTCIVELTNGFEKYKSIVLIQ